MNRHLYDLVFWVILFMSCRRTDTVKPTTQYNRRETVVRQKPQKSKEALKMDSLGMVNIADVDSTILIKLMYATKNNFTGKVLYKELREAYLRPNAANALTEAQKLLRKMRPSYKLIVYDAARPMHIQKEMWNVVKGTDKEIYVSNPAHGGGLHNYGMAVDISITDSSGHSLPMGTHVDYMGKASHINHEEMMVRKGIISKEEMKNRRLLRYIMKSEGFRPLLTEWWHFNFCSRKVARRKYPVIP